MATNLASHGRGQDVLHGIIAVTKATLTVKKITACAVLTWKSKKFDIRIRFLDSEIAADEFSQICLLPLPWIVSICGPVLLTDSRELLFWSFSEAADVLGRFVSFISLFILTPKVCVAA